MTSALAVPDYDVEQIVAQRRLRTVFQPLVRLEDRQVVGFEALTRGPLGSRLETPDALFAEAQRVGLTSELDWACRASALQAAMDSNLPPETLWFINVEAQALNAACPDHLVATMLRGAELLHIVVEITERDLVRDPAGLLYGVHRIRRSGFGLALDDVGADPSSLALLPLVEPDIIKLDMRLIGESGAAEVIAIVNAVRAHAEATGAVVLAEGIETEQDEVIAKTTGASLGQGWLFGRPGELAPTAIAPVLGGFPRPLRLEATGGRGRRTPFEIVAGSRPVSHTERRLLLPVSRHLEAQSLIGSNPGVLLTCLQNEQHSPPALMTFQTLAARAGLAVVFGSGFEATTVDGVRLVAVDADDPLASEWNVIVLGAHYAAAMVARDLGDDGPAGERRVEYVVTHDRALVVLAARSLLAWCRDDAANASPSGYPPALAPWLRHAAKRQHTKPPG